MQHNLAYWQDKYRVAADKFQAVKNAMDEREAIRLGTKQIKSPTGGRAKSATNVRKIVYELIESQIDSSIPMPKVTATQQRNVLQARSLENKLRNEIDRLPFEAMNDEQERVCPTQGGSLFLVEWDSTKSTHTTTGELVVTSLHPKQLIPQPEVYEIERMDYLFVLMARTREYIRRRYGIEVESENGADEHQIDIVVDGIIGSGERNEQELVTQVMCYYRNDNGGIGLMSWVNDTVLDDFEDYQARRGEVCKTCGADKQGEVCEVCGSTEFVESDRDYEVLAVNTMLPSGEVIPAGEQIPYYKPDVYPIVLRKNVSTAGSFLGASDVDAIADQQAAVAKYSTKIEEKMFKGGSLVTLPKNVKVEKTEEELKIVYVEPQQKAMIDVYNLQPNIAADQQALETNDQWAKSTLGITDSFQGKRDATATSGKAKEFAASQSAGRLESKRVMKRAAYADLFQVMAKFLIAYTDEPRNVRMEDENGQTMYTTFSKYDFLERDDAGELYYNVDYLFSTDSAATLAANREAMWQETRMNFREGTFGNPQDPHTQRLFWQIMESLSYPSAGIIKKQIEEQIAKAEQAQQMQQMQQPQMGGMNQQMPSGLPVPTDII